MEAPLKRNLRGFAVQEVIVGLVIFGVAIVPLIKAFSQLPGLAAAVGIQNRVESWRSAVDSAVLAGIDPASAKIVDELVGSSASRNLSPRIKRAAVPPSPMRYDAQLALIYDDFQGTAELRAVAAGFEIGASESATGPIRTDPLPPLPPRKLPEPVITSPSSPAVLVSNLASTGVVGAPHIATIVARGSDMVVLRKESPTTAEVRDSAQASLNVTAVELAFLVRGFTWAEYPGTTVDIAIPLSGGRTRWLVKKGNQTEVVDPSDLVPFAFGVSLGRPVFHIGETEHPSGSSIAIDIVKAKSIESGQTAARVTFPDFVQRAFGSEWEALAPSFDLNFGPLDRSALVGSAGEIFGAPHRRFWQQNQLFTASPRPAFSGLSVSSGSWRLEREVTRLHAPERVADHYEGILDAPGYIEFSAPILAGLSVRIGRPEFNGVQSTAETLSVAVVP